MARQRIPVQVNQFVGGLVTEANPLNFPANASADEENMEILKDGSRVRRDGFNVEDSFVEKDTGLAINTNKTLARSQFRWENPGGVGNKELLVTQIGNYLAVYDLDVIPLSNGLIYSYTFDSFVYDITFGYANVDGRLVIGTGLKQINILSYNSVANTVSRTEDILLIRDLFGVEATISGVTLTDFLNVGVRPATTNDNHNYNLRNQTWALPRVEGDADTNNNKDPIDEFYTDSTNTAYPSNADNVNPHLVADANKTSNRTVERFNAKSILKNPPNNVRAPQGFFVIDALERGASRKAQYDKLLTEHPILGLPITALPLDKTPNGPNVLTQYSGRVWYAGFSAEVEDGDSKSPRVSSYVLFSRVVQDPSQITKCFQEADPTSHIDPDLVDTDGGFLKVDGAYGIKALIPVKASLFVLAQNGVWRINGPDNDSFRATSYSVSKITDKGIVGSNSVVVFNSSIFYWSDTSIQLLSQNEFGDWSAEDITEDTVKSLYLTIPQDDKTKSIGYYDVSSNTIRWLYGASPGNNTQSKELVLNTRFRVFTKNAIGLNGLVEGPISVSGGQPLSANRFGFVTINGVNVTVNGENVTTRIPNFGRDASKTLYCIVTDYSPTIKYTFGGYINGTIYDWIDFGQVDAPAYLVTGSITGGDGRVRKNVPYLTAYFKRTEDFDPTEESSCIFSSTWDWTTDPGTGKWSNPRQAYRVQRPTQGNILVSTRNKVRGFGKSVSFKFESQPGKTMRIYGWEFNVEATSEE